MSANVENRVLNGNYFAGTTPCIAGAPYWVDGPYILDVTPETADAMLRDTGRLKQRNLDSHHVAKLAEELRLGLWEWNGQSIVRYRFEDDGQIETLEGRHRLKAISHSGLTVRMQFSGLSGDEERARRLQTTYDGQKRRSMYDNFAFLGITDGLGESDRFDLKAGLSAFAVWRDLVHGNMAKFSLLSNPIRQRMFEESRSEVVWLANLRTYFRSWRGEISPNDDSVPHAFLLSAGAMAAFYDIHIQNPGGAEEMYRRASDLSRSLASAENTLHDLLIGGYRRSWRGYRIWFTVKHGAREGDKGRKSPCLSRGDGLGEYLFWYNVVSQSWNAYVAGVPFRAETELDLFRIVPPVTRQEGGE